ncbi:MAG: hypothetical protein AAF598_13920 [Bacteroidota bacterium]
MSDTRITPDEFEEMSLSNYRRHLIKDLLRLSKRETLRPYMYFWRANFANKKNKDCLLFIDEDDKKWAEVISYMRDKDRGACDRMAAGVLKLFNTHDLDDDGDDDILVAIRSAHGSLKRNGVIDHFNKRLFDGESDFFAILLSEVDDYTQEQLKAELPKRNKVKLKGFDPEKNEKALEDVDELSDHNRSFLTVMDGETPMELVGNLRKRILDLELKVNNTDSEEISDENLREAEKMDEEIDELQQNLDPLLDDGMELLEKLTFQDQELADAFSERLGILKRMQGLLAKLELQLETSFGIPKD